MLPPSLGEMIAPDHPVRFAAAFVAGLDASVWAEMGIDRQGNPRRASAYDPRALLGVWVYGFMTGVRSSRKLEAACREQLPYIWLMGTHKPDHNTLWRFYKAHRAGMRKLLPYSVRIAVRAGLVDLALQAVDGTRIGANASSRRTLNLKQLERLLARVEQAVADLESQNDTGGDVTKESRLAGAKGYTHVDDDAGQYVILTQKLAALEARRRLVVG